MLDGFHAAKALLPCGILLLLVVSGHPPVPAAIAGEPQRLNNLVSTLVEGHYSAAPRGTEIVFSNPQDGWVYIRCQSDGRDSPSVDLSWSHVEGETGLVHVDADASGPEETMRFMAAGDHTLRLRGSGDSPPVSVVVREMPETHYVRFPQEPRYPELGTFSWDWLSRHVLPSVTTVVGYPQKDIDPVINQWTRNGRRFIAYGGLPRQENLTAHGAWQYWLQHPGFEDARLSGLIADEFQGRQHPLYPAWIEGIRRLGLSVHGSGKAFYGYCGGPGMYSRPQTRELVKAVFDSRFYMAWERYHHEMPTLREARGLMDDLLGNEMKKWRAAFPDCQRQMILVLGIFATGPDLDVQPQVNYKVWMDMQMQYLATHPLFQGLFGVQWWYCGAANEELLRWQNALYRHYCIEGKNERLSEHFGWTYMLPHVKNPDFYHELKHWDVVPAGPETLRAGYLERYARIQNRYWQRQGYPDDPAGNTYLWMQRSAQRPNVVYQQIKKLSPGAVYTVQMITADYEDIVQGRSQKKRHVASLCVDGGEVIPEGSYQSVPVSSPWSHPQLPFENGPAWFNHHRLMFRATSHSARLTITDWASPESAGGPIGEQLMINYLQLQPYFAQESL